MRHNAPVSSKLLWVGRDSDLMVEPAKYCSLLGQMLVMVSTHNIPLRLLADKQKKRIVGNRKLRLLTALPDTPTLEKWLASNLKDGDVVGVDPQTMTRDEWTPIQVCKYLKLLA